MKIGSAPRKNCDPALPPIEVSPSGGTLRGLDWLGPFLAIYLAGYAWNEQRVGIALTVGGIVGLAVGALLIAFAPAFWPVMSDQVLIGATSSIFGPAICAISLGVVGHADLTQGSGRFNLTLGAISTAVGIGASLSQVIAGSIVHHLGANAGFLFLAAVAAAAFGILYLCMPETREKRFVNPTL